MRAERFIVWMESTITMSGLVRWMDSTTASMLVVELKCRCGVSTPRREARSLICRRLSSPDTYKICGAACCPPSILWQICSSRVDLPMPGSPLSRMTEPGTMPPPSTRLSSCIRVR